MTNDASARVDMVSSRFYPPSREVGFNGRLRHNDGLLISHLSARLKLNYVDARKLVESFTKELKRKLEAGKTVNFEGIGRFIIDRNKNLVFDPDGSANFLTEAYGLSFFRYPQLDGGKRSLLDKNTPVIRETKYPGGRGKKLLRYAAIGIPLIVAISWGAMNTSLIREFRFNLSSLNPFSAVIDSGIKKVRPADEFSELPGSSITFGEHNSFQEPFMADEVTEPGVTDLPEAEQTSVRPHGQEGEAAGGPAVDFSFPDATENLIEESIDDAGETSPVESLRRYHIVAGSFSHRNNALTFIGQLEEKGYNCQIIESEEGMYRVSIFASSSSSEALDMLNKLRKQENKQNVWMLTR